MCDTRRMPELPEVEIVARQLAPQLTRRTVRRLRIHDDRLRNGRVPVLGGRSVVEVGRSGKRVLIQLSPRPGQRQAIWLAVHL